MTAQTEPKLGLMRPGFAISCIGHVAMLTIGLLFAGANPFESAPADAITVEIVSPNEVGEPGAAPAGAAEEAPSFEATASTQQPATPAQPAVPAQPQAMAPAQPAAQAMAPARPAAQPQATASAQPPSTARATSALVQGTPQAVAPTQALPSAPSSMPWFQPLPDPAPPAETQQFNPGDMFGMPLTLPGGAVGYESPAEATEKADITGDVIAAFHEHLKSCSTLPAGVGAEAKVTLRIQLNPDGTLFKSPENPHAVGLVSGLSVGVGDLFRAAMAAVRKCQPYKMLPPDRYEEWKTFDITFTGANFGGG